MFSKKNDQLKILNRMMNSITIFGNFDFFPTDWMVENTPFQNQALLRKRLWSVKSTQAFFISYMYSQLFHQKSSPLLEGPVEL